MEPILVSSGVILFKGRGVVIFRKTIDPDKRRFKSHVVSSICKQIVI